jgi:periplasmic protein TonB
MYDTRSVSGRSRTTGLATVVALHVGLVGVLMTMKPVATFLPVPRPIPTVLLPDTTTPPELIDLPMVPDDVSLSPAVVEDTMLVPEFVSDVFAAVTPTIPLSTNPGTVTQPPRTSPDVRRSALMPSKIEKPPYPRASERLNEEGLSTVEACISPKGAVSSARLVESSGFSRLDLAAVQWVKDLRGFKPATLNGTPVSDCFSIPVEWKIETR